MSLKYTSFNVRFVKMYLEKNTFNVKYDEKKHTKKYMLF